MAYYYCIIINLFIIFISLFLKLNCQTGCFFSLLCLYPHCFSLYNGNNIVCCKDGIYSYNSDFTKKLYFKEFSTPITDNIEADFVTISQFKNNGNVILLRKEEFYFLSSNGESLFNKEIELDNKGKYYTLVPYKYQNNYYFIVGLINGSSLITIKYYRINISLENIELIRDYVVPIQNSKSHHGFDCQLMNSNSFGDIITCFHFNISPGKIGTFSLYLNSSLGMIDDLTKLLEVDMSPKFLKTVPSPDRTKVLIGFSDLSGNGYYSKYDINNAEFTEVTKYMNNFGGDFPSSVQIQYFKQTHEYIFSFSNKNIFKMAKFDKDMNIIIDEGLNSQIENDFAFDWDTYGIYFHNIVFIPEYKTYVFIMDTNFKGNKTARFFYLPDSFTPSTIYPIETIQSNSIFLSTLSSISQTTISTIPNTIILKIPTTIINNIPIINTIPSTIITKLTTEPTTILKTISSIIPTSINTTIVSTMHSSILSRLPNTIISEIPTTILSNLYSTIISTIPTISKISTTILSPIETTLISTIQTTKISSLPDSSIPTTVIITVPNTIMSTNLSIKASIITSNIVSQIISSTSPLLFISSTQFEIKSNIPFTNNILKTLPFIENSTIPSVSNYLTSSSQSLTSTFPFINNINNSESCSFEYFYKNIKANECKSFCSTNELINENCFINNITENNIMNITQDIRNLIKVIEINKNINVVINGNNVIYQIISSEKMDENNNKNISIIELGECGEIIKKKYNIDYIIILQCDIFDNNGTNIVLNYEIYDPNTLEKIDLSICSGMSIDTYLPYQLSDEDLELYIDLHKLGYDLFNPNDSFYHDICIPYTTFDKTDILLDDRRIDYFKNISFCEEGCTYKQYNYLNEKVQCECPIQKEFKYNIDNIKFYGNLLFISFFKIDNFSNIKVLKCFKLVFSKFGQTNNIGSYIFIFFIFIFIIIIILFHIYGKTQISTIIDNIVHQKIIKSPPIKKNNKKNKKNMNKIIINKKVIINNKNYINFKKLKNNKKIKLDNSKNLLTIKRKSNKSDSRPLNSNLNKKNTKITKNNIIKKISKFSIYNINKKNKAKAKMNKSSIYIYNDIELNYLEYKDAIKYDKRTYGQFYCSLLKQKQLLLFTFISKVDYNLFIIKLSLFIFSLSLNFSVTGLFFNDITLHEIYKSKGNLNYDCIYNLLHIIYSTIISSTITIFLKYLALSNSSILIIKKIKNRNKAIKQSSIIIKQLKIKFNIYFILSFLLLIFFWYFISSFCAVYKNSQILLIENTLSSFALSLIYPFGLYLLPGILRIYALRKKNKKCLFSLGNLIP